VAFEPGFLMIDAKIGRRFNHLLTAMAAVKLKLARKSEQDKLSEAMRSCSNWNSKLRTFLL
jgi:hypothetical protein